METLRWVCNKADFFSIYFLLKSTKLIYSSLFQCRTQKFSITKTKLIYSSKFIYSSNLFDKVDFFFTISVTNTKILDNKDLKNKLTFLELCRCYVDETSVSKDIKYSFSRVTLTQTGPLRPTKINTLDQYR